MSNVSRRTALSVLGIAPTIAIAAEDAGKTIGGDQFPSNFGVENGRKIADALRALATDIDEKNSFITSFSLNSAATQEEFLTHRLTIDFVLAVDKPAQS